MKQSLYFVENDYKTMNEYLSLFPQNNKKELMTTPKHEKKLRKKNNQLVIVGRHGCGKTFFVNSTITNHCIHWVTSDWSDSNLESLINKVIDSSGTKKKTKQTTQKTGKQIKSLAFKPIESYFKAPNNVHEKIAIVFDSFDEKLYSGEQLKRIEQLVEMNTFVPVIFTSANLDTKSLIFQKAFQKIEITFQRQIDNEDQVLDYLRSSFEKPIFSKKRIRTLIELCEYDLSNIIQTLKLENATNDVTENAAEYVQKKDDNKTTTTTTTTILMKDKNLENFSTVDLCRICVQSDFPQEREDALRKLNAYNFWDLFHRNYLFVCSLCRPCVRSDSKKKEKKDDPTHNPTHDPTHNPTHDPTHNERRLVVKTKNFQNNRTQTDFNNQLNKIIRIDTKKLIEKLTLEEKQLPKKEEISNLVPSWLHAHNVCFDICLNNACLLSDMDILQNSVSSETSIDLVNIYISTNYDWIKHMPCSY